MEIERLKLKLKLEYYTQALEHLPKGHPITIVYLNNRSLSYFKIESFKKCIQDCSAVLEIDKFETKAALRRVIFKKIKIDFYFCSFLFFFFF